MILKRTLYHNIEFQLHSLYKIFIPSKISFASIPKAKQNLKNKLMVILCSFLNTLLTVVSDQLAALANSDLFTLNFERNSLYILLTSSISICSICFCIEQRKQMANSKNLIQFDL